MKKLITSCALLILTVVMPTLATPTIDGIVNTGSGQEWDGHYLGTVTTTWQGGTSTDVYAFIDGGNLYAAYVADMTTPGWAVAESMGISANLDYWTPSTTSWPAAGYTHISPSGDGFARTDGSSWVWPDGYGNGDWSGRGIELYVGTIYDTYMNTAEVKIPLSQLNYAGTDGVIGLSGQYWGYNFAPALFVPEPATLGLLLIGGLTLLRRRRK